MIRRFLSFKRPKVNECPSLAWRRVSRVLPYIVAESEEQDSTPEWGEIASSDIGLDSVENTDDE